MTDKSGRELKVGDWVLYICKSLHCIIRRVYGFSPKQVYINDTGSSVSPKSLLIINELPIDKKNGRYL